MEVAAWMVVLVLGPAAVLGVLWLGWKLLPYFVAVSWGLVAVLALARQGGPDETAFMAGLVSLIAMLWIGKRWYRR
ncbi:hypothetical protein [Azohydromonas caseinilytica]|uniref:Uncharacterized protein n=1 Tax=Azohydromonas caseinilytica TaxID=2728836 RepID=A0A848F700_9BURK|nr:hypothetical protein [Azohydromonas caseinilytica]NML14938.1 hypothetical protein [Azohydromonas caseinilytica]